MEFTPEHRAKAKAAREAALAASQHYRRNWLDSDLWDDLAKTMGIKLPTWSKRPTPRKLKQWHERLDKESFEDVYGAKPARIIALNEHTPLRAFVGMMLERSSTKA